MIQINRDALAPPAGRIRSHDWRARPKPEAPAQDSVELIGVPTVVGYARADGQAQSIFSRVIGQLPLRTGAPAAPPDARRGMCVALSCQPAMTASSRSGRSCTMGSRPG